MNSVLFNSSTTISPWPSSPSMKDISLFLIKNSFASKMKRGIRNFCHNVGSTNTLSQINEECTESSSNNNNVTGKSPTNKTLEEMLVQLDLEEAAARRAKLEEHGELNRRMSCVNNSDILRSARSALNQYPRFSLDGKDAMYRASFRSANEGYNEPDLERRGGQMPRRVGGECVVWCKAGVVAKLMGLEVIPVPLVRRRRSGSVLNSGCMVGRNSSLRRVGRCELEKDRAALKLRRESGVDNTKGFGENWQFKRAR